VHARLFGSLKPMPRIVEEPGGHPRRSLLAHFRSIAFG
jgi:hypothetical protein